jgi:outer membrane receptor protein involved in Fe transport
MQARYTGKGWQSFQGLDPGDPGFQWNQYNTVMEQELPSWTTYNLTTSYNFARSRFALEKFENLQLSLTVDNLFDKQPDFYSSTSATGGVNTRFYNGNGRTFRLNFRSQF